MGYQNLCAQGVTPKEPPTSFPNQNTLIPAPATPQIPQAPDSQSPDLSTVPHASSLSPDQPLAIADVASDNPQTRHGEIGFASGNVVVTYGDHVLRADAITYDHSTETITAEGNVELTGGANDEHISASRAIYNLRTQTGRFFDVHGSVGLFRASAEPTFKPTNAGITTPSSSSRLPGYQNSNPFVFQGRLVLKTGPTDYTIYNGWVTSCLLPHPDWTLYAGRIALNSGKAQASKSTFKLLGIPVFFFPYVTHPVDNQQRQSGLLIPELGYSSASANTGSKGITIGEQLYLVLGRSADLTVGSIYYSLRGFSENGTFRYKGYADNFFNAHFSALQDRGFYAPGVNAEGQPVTVYNNQGGEDITSSFRRQFSPNIRAVGDVEYLSSWIYREVFTPNFNQAVSTDITSILYLIQQKDGFSLDTRVDRYEGLKVVQTDFSPAEEVKIYHMPSIDFSGVDHSIPNTPFRWSFASSVAGLKRVEPDFATAGLTWRLDLRPEISLPLHFDGWHVLATAAVRETAYTRSRQTPYGNNAVPVESDQGINRADLDLSVDVHPPTLERTFPVSPRWQHIFGDEITHTIEPVITYRDTRGINNFLSVLRFDDVDLQSDTDELKYGVTQHLYFRPHPKPPAKPKPGCPATPVTVAIPTGKTPAVDTLDPDERATTDANGIPNAVATAPDQPLRTHPRKPDPCAQPASIPPQKEWFSWILAQKVFFNPTFGNAVIDGRRNIFTTTLDFSGIAFLTQPRNISPLKSRMRFRTSSHLDVAWDFDYDTGAKKFLSSNTYLDFHEGKIFGGFSYALLNAPGRNYTEDIDTTTNEVTGFTSSAIANFSQMRVLFGYGKPSEPGLSAAGSAGIDLNLGTAQYITLQTNYNWNCCGFSIEYRKYDLGTIRNEGAYSFNFTLANIGTAGNLRRAASLF